MFCVNCGNELAEEWKVCPKCGTEVINQKDEKNTETPEKRVCEKCGNELQDDWVKCPFCGSTEQEEALQQDVKQNSHVKKFEFEGFRRTGRFGFQYITSNIEVNGEHINVVVHKKKEQSITFAKQNISEIKFPILPVIGPMDIFRIVLFLLLMFLSKGLAIFAVLFFFKITLVRHMQITLQDGSKVEIPIRQKAESVDFLREINYPERNIQSIESSAVSNSRIVVGEWILSTLMLIIAAVTLYIGMQDVADKLNERNTGMNVEKVSVSGVVENGSETNQTEQKASEVKEIDYASLYDEVMDLIISEVSGRGGIIQYLKYAYYDIDKDGYLEFIMENGTCNADMKIEVYSTRDGKTVFKVGECGAGTFYECPGKNGFYTDYAHMDYETVTRLYIENDELREEVIYKDIYTLEYGYVNGSKIQELEYPMEVHMVNEILFVGMSGTYQCGSDEESGVIDIYIVDENNVSIRIGTHNDPVMLGGTGTMLDKYTVTMEWNGGCVFTLTWSDTGIFTIQREGSCGISDVDEITNTVEYVNAGYYGVS